MLRFLIYILFFSLSLKTYSGDPQKILFFLVGGGMGHITQARAVDEVLKKEFPQTTVQYINAQRFLHPVIDRMGVLNNLFANYTRWARGVRFQKKVVSHQNSQIIDELEIPPFDLENMAEFIRGHNPSVVLVNHYGTAAAIAQLKKSNMIDKDIKLGWLHADYDDTLTYFHLIAKNFDMTFLPARELIIGFQTHGVPRKKLRSIGMPISKDVYIKVEHHEIEEYKYNELGIPPHHRVIVVLGGGLGIFKYHNFTRELFKGNTTPTTIINLTAKNHKEFIKTEQLRVELEKHGSIHKLINFELIDQRKLFNIIRAADFVFAKPGGATPAEVFTIGRPMIVINDTNTQEYYSAKFFEREGFALVVENETEAAKLYKKIQKNQTVQNSMLKAQKHFSNGQDFTSLLEFIKNSQDFHKKIFGLKEKQETIISSTGLENGTPVLNQDEIFEHLQDTIPSRFEVYLNYAMSTRQGTLSNLLINPFGHIGIRVDDRVYNLNYKAKRGHETGLITELSEGNFFYNVVRNNKHDDFGGNFGIANVRSTIGLRVTGTIEPDKLSAIKEAFEQINKEWRDEKISFNHLHYNCATSMYDLLNRAGLKINLKSKDFITPRDLFESFLRWLDQEKISYEFVQYERLPHPNIYPANRFPMRIRRLGQAVIEYILSTWFRLSTNNYQNKVKYFVSPELTHIGHKVVLKEKCEDKFL